MWNGRKEKVGVNKKTLGCCYKIYLRRKRVPHTKKKKEPVSRNTASDWIIPLTDVTRTLIGVSNQGQCNAIKKKGSTWLVSHIDKSSPLVQYMFITAFTGVEAENRQKGFFLGWHEIETTEKHHSLEKKRWNIFCYEWRQIDPCKGFFNLHLLCKSLLCG